MRLLALVAALLLAAPVAAEERIGSFDSRIAIQKDGSLDVTEAIDVTAEGNAIRHGIFRDFPTRYRGRRGEVMHVRFTLLGTLLDGQPEPAVTETRSNGVRIKIGLAERDVTEGEHRYTIHYRATREIGRFEGFDELYWNVTGNGWQFPIDRASAVITLPSPARFGQRAVYTGAQGSSRTDASVTDEAPGRIAFATTTPLGPYEGMTIAVAFPKGVVDPLSEGDRAGYWLADHGPTLAGFAGLGGLLFFLWYAWRRVGQDPRAGTVVPLFAPPDELSPAAMRFVTKMGADNRAFAAALVDLGVKGHIRLIEEDGGWFGKDKKRIERTLSTEPLPPAERAMLDALVGPGESIEMVPEKHGYFAEATERLQERFKQDYEGRLFRRNTGWAAIGIGILVAAMWIAAAAVLLAQGSGTAAALVVVSAGLALVAALLFAVAGDSEGIAKYVIGGLAVLAGCGAVVIALPVIPAAVATGNLVPMLIPLVGVPLVIASFWWISAPTREGRGVLDRIAGFRQYLSIAEGERLDRMTSPTETLETFEKFLPYAIALGVENRWSDRFQSQLAAAAVAGQTQGFLWYSGSSSPWTDVGGFAETLGSGLSSAVSSASTAPGSSSGSGGGGGGGW